MARYAKGSKQMIDMKYINKRFGQLILEFNSLIAEKENADGKIRTTQG